MLAARDKENRLFGHSTGGPAGRPHTQGPKTPGAQYPNTPPKVHLKDENATTRLAGGKSVLGVRSNGGNENLRTVSKARKGSLVTPLEPRTARAPLGNKTTNAKAHTLQQHHNQQQKGRAGVKDIVREIEKSQQQQQRRPPMSGTRRQKTVSPSVNPFKLSVLNDEQTAKKRQGGEEEDIEYAAPRDPTRPYESDVFPDGVLTFAAFKPQNRLCGYHDHYYNPVDGDGVLLRDKEFAEKQRRAFEKLDIRVQEDINSFDWSIGDVPASKTYLASRRKQQTVASLTPVPPPPTIASRNAASALALSSISKKPLNPGTLKSNQDVRKLTPAPSSTTSILSSLPLRKPSTASALPLRSRGTNNPLSESASRTTLGYNKGRTALSLVRGTGAPHAPPSARVTSSLSRARQPGPAADTNDASVSTAAQASSSSSRDGFVEARSLAFLSIFEVDDDQDNLGGAGTFVNGDLDDGFQMDTKF